MVQQKLVSSEKTIKDKGIHQDKPELRFPEFTDSWKIIKIEDNAIIKGRIGWKNLKSEEYTDEGPYLIAGKHIKNGIINWDECDHITIERYDESPEIALKDGDIIFSKDGSLGNPALIRNLGFEATINGTMMLVRLDQNKINPNYFYQVLNSDYFFRLLHILKSGSSIPHIFQRDMVNFKFPICSLEEQKKISIFLEKIDKKIELLEKKCYYYHELKTYFMQQIFTQELRFLANENEWNWLKFEDIFKTLSTKKYQIKSAEINNSGLYEVIDQGQQSIAGYHNDNSKLFNDLPIIIYGDHTTFIKYRNEPFIVGADGVKLLSLKIDVDMKYVYYALNYFNIKPEGYKRHFSIIKKINLPIPSKSEQKNISNFLSNFDNKINFIEIQRKNLHEFKNGLLQKMFV